MKNIFILISFIFCINCYSNNRNTKYEMNDKQLYFLTVKDNVCHCNENCLKLEQTNSSIIGGHSIRFKRIKNLKYCKYCFGNKMYSKRMIKKLKKDINKNFK